MLLKPYFTEYGLSAADIIKGGRREPFNHKVADVLEEFKPAL